MASPIPKRPRLTVKHDDEASSGSSSSQELKENDVTTDCEIVISSDVDDSPRTGPKTSRTPGGKRKLKEKIAAQAAREAQKQKKLEERAAAKQREQEERQQKMKEKERQRLEREKENEARRRRKFEAEELVRQKRIETQLQKEELKAAKVREELERLEKKRQEEAEKLEKKRLVEQTKKEEEERKIEEQQRKQNLLKRQSNILMSFIKKQAKPEPKLFAPPNNHWLFRPLEKKENMELAPIHSRPQLTNDQKEKLLTTKVAKSDYLETLKRPILKRNLDKVKFFQFHENFRPPYYGTWRKTSTVINGRNPFATLEPTINYEDDSDAEWENDEEGDECVSEDEEEDDSVNSDNEDDGFIVEHGYLSNDEGLSDDEKEHLSDETEEERKARLAERAKQWKEEQRQKQRRNKTKELKPNSVGPMYLSAVPDEYPQLIEGIQLTYVN